VDGRFFYPLRPGDGYWGSVSDSHEQQLKSLLMRATGEVIEIPIPTPVVTAPKYSDYLGAYFYQRNYSSGPGIVDKVWTLKPTGETELLEMPTGPWARGGRYYWPVKNGWILISSALSIRPPHFPGDAGLYFISEGKAKRFVAGFPEPFAGAISPDGCRFVSPLQLRPGERPQLHLIDVCDSRR
ncbi:MAG: hypothetical protein ACREYF_03275, partial [Gammaproteobacteria bacterium]